MPKEGVVALEKFVATEETKEDKLDVSDLQAIIKEAIYLFDYLIFRFEESHWTLHYGLTLTNIRGEEHRKLLLFFNTIAVQCNTVLSKKTELFKHFWTCLDLISGVEKSEKMSNVELVAKFLRLSCCEEFRNILQKLLNPKLLSLLPDFSRNLEKSNMLLTIYQIFEDPKHWQFLTEVYYAYDICVKHKQKLRNLPVPNANLLEGVAKAVDCILRVNPARPILTKLDCLVIKNLYQLGIENKHHRIFFEKPHHMDNVAYLYKHFKKICEVANTWEKQRVRVLETIRTLESAEEKEIKKVHPIEEKKQELTPGSKEKGEDPKPAMTVFIPTPIGDAPKQTSSVSESEVADNLRKGAALCNFLENPKYVSFFAEVFILGEWCASYETTLGNLDVPFANLLHILNGVIYKVFETVQLYDCAAAHLHLGHVKGVFDLAIRTPHYRCFLADPQNFEFLTIVLQHQGDLENLAHIWRKQREIVFNTTGKLLENMKTEVKKNEPGKEQKTAVLLAHSLSKGLTSDKENTDPNIPKLGVTALPRSLGVVPKLTTAVSKSVGMSPAPMFISPGFRSRNPVSMLSIGSGLKLTDCVIKTAGPAPRPSPTPSVPVPALTVVFTPS